MKHSSLEYTARRTKIKIPILIFVLSLFACSQAEFLRPALSGTPALGISSKLGVISRAYLGVMEGPATKDKVVFPVRAGEIVAIQERTESQSDFNGESGYWYKIRFNDNSGWVFSKNLIPCNDENQAKYVAQRIKETVFY